MRRIEFSIRVDLTTIEFRVAILKKREKRDGSQSKRTLALPPFDKAIRASRKVGGSERKEKTGDPDFTADLRFDRSDRGEVGR